MDPKVPGKGRCKSEYNNYKDNIARQFEGEYFMQLCAQVFV